MAYVLTSDSKILQTILQANDCKRQPPMPASPCSSSAGQTVINWSEICAIITYGITLNTEDTHQQEVVSLWI